MPSEMKVALVTGANRGIGFETARQLGQKGITVVVGSRTQRAAEEAAGKLIAESIEAYPVALDITRDADRKAAASFITETFGKLDILINNAGVRRRGRRSERSHDRDLSRKVGVGFRHECLRRRRNHAGVPAPCSRRVRPDASSTSAASWVRSPCRRCRRARLPR